MAVGCLVECVVRVGENLPAWDSGPGLSEGKVHFAPPTQAGPAGLLH